MNDAREPDLPKEERYSYAFEGNSQVLDQILLSTHLLDAFGVDYDSVNVNAKFADQASDHDPQVARLGFPGPGVTQDGWADVAVPEEVPDGKPVG